MPMPQTETGKIFLIFRKRQWPPVAVISPLSLLVLPTISARNTASRLMALKSPLVVGVATSYRRILNLIRQMHKAALKATEPIVATSLTNGSLLTHQEPM